MKQIIGFILLTLLWLGIGLRVLYPADIHGVYTGQLAKLIWTVDGLLITPPWFLLELFVVPYQMPWAYFVSTGVYLTVLSAIIYFVFIRKPKAGSA